LDTTSGGGDIIPKGDEKDKSISITATTKPTGVARTPGITCIGEICFTNDGFIVKIPEDADPECARRVAEDILKGDAKITYEVSPKAIAKSRDDYMKVGKDLFKDKKQEIAELEKRLKELKKQ